MFNGITSRALSLCRARYYNGKTSPEKGNTVDKVKDTVSEEKWMRLKQEINEIKSWMTKEEKEVNLSQGFFDENFKNFMDDYAKKNINSFAELFNNALSLWKNEEIAGEWFNEVKNILMETAYKYVNKAFDSIKKYNVVEKEEDGKKVKFIEKDGKEINEEERSELAELKWNIDKFLCGWGSKNFNLYLSSENYKYYDELTLKLNELSDKKTRMDGWSHTDYRLIMWNTRQDILNLEDPSPNQLMFYMTSMHRASNKMPITFFRNGVQLEKIKKLTVDHVNAIASCLKDITRPEDSKTKKDVTFNLRIPNNAKVEDGVGKILENNNITLIQ